MTFPLHPRLVTDAEIPIPVSSPSLSTSWRIFLKCLSQNDVRSSYLSRALCYDYITYSDHILVDTHLVNA